MATSYPPKQNRATLWPPLEGCQPFSRAVSCPLPAGGAASCDAAAGGLLERAALGRVQLDLDDPLDAAGAEHDRHSDEQVLDAVLALEVCRAGQDPLAVEQDRVEHLHHPGRGGVEGRAGLEQVDDL